MATTRYFFQASQEHFPPEDLLAQAVEAEQLGPFHPGLIAQARRSTRCRSADPWPDPPQQVEAHGGGAGHHRPPVARRDLEAVRKWKGAQPDDIYREDIHKPANVYEHGEETTSDEDMKEGFIVAADPAEHVERICAARAMG